MRSKYRLRSYLNDESSHTHSNHSNQPISARHHHHHHNYNYKHQNKKSQLSFGINSFGSAPSSDQQRKYEKKYEKLTENKKNIPITKDILPTLSGIGAKLNRRKYQTHYTTNDKNKFGNYNTHQHTNKFRFNKYTNTKRVHKPLLTTSNNILTTNRGNRFRRLGDSLLHC
eukprot:916999_1